MFQTHQGSLARPGPDDCWRRSAVSACRLSYRTAWRRRLNRLPNSICRLRLPVTFVVTEGSGKVNGQTSVTVTSGATGHAQVAFTYGLAGGNNRIRATFPGNETKPVEFVLQGIVRDESQPTTFSSARMRPNLGMRSASCNFS